MLKNNNNVQKQAHKRNKCFYHANPISGKPPPIRYLLVFATANITHIWQFIMELLNTLNKLHRMLKPWENTMGYPKRWARKPPIVNPLLIKTRLS